MDSVNRMLSKYGMKTFSIAELESLSGLKAHTLRMWEKRYSVFNPERKKGNVRLYSIDDLRKAMKLSLLGRNGFKVSSFYMLSNEQLGEKINELELDCAKQENAVNDLIVCMHKVDTEYFEAIVEKCLSSWTIDIFLAEIVYKFLQKTGLLWQGNRLTEEHFIVTILRRKIIRCIEQVEVYGRKEKKVLLFLPQSGQMDLMLLYTMYLLKIKGFKIYYMGNDVSVNNLKGAIQLKQPDYILTYFPERSNFKVSELSSIMYDLIPHAKFIITNNAEVELKKENHDNVIYLGYEEAISFMDI